MCPNDKTAREHSNDCRSTIERVPLVDIDRFHVGDHLSLLSLKLGVALSFAVMLQQGPRPVILTAFQALVTVQVVTRRGPHVVFTAYPGARCVLHVAGELFRGLPAVGCSE